MSELKKGLLENFESFSFISHLGLKALKGGL